MFNVRRHSRLKDRLPSLLRERLPANSSVLKSPADGEFRESFMIRSMDKRAGKIHQLPLTHRETCPERSRRRAGVRGGIQRNHYPLIQAYPCGIPSIE